MSILAANLKHIYQRRGLWFLYVILFCQLPLVFLPLKLQKTGTFVAYLIISFFVGLIIAMLQKEILAKPFSFCMPKHRQIPCRFVFLVGGVLNILLGLIFLGYNGLEFPYVLAVVCAGAFVGMMFYLLGTFFVFSTKNSMALIGFLPLIVIAAVFLELNKPLEYMIVYSPFSLIVAGTLVCALAWTWLGRDSLARQFYGQIMLTLGDCWNVKKVQKYRQAKTLKRLCKSGTTFSVKIEELFLAKMGRHKFFSGGRYIWGTTYMLLGNHLSLLRISQIVPFLLLILLLGYVRMNNFLFIFPVFGAIQLNLLPYRTMLLPGGRTDKYHAALILGLAITVFATLLVTGTAILTVWLESLLPDITLKGLTFTYRAMNVQYFYICSLVVPIALMLGTVFPQKGILKLIFIMILMYLWILWHELLGPLTIRPIFAISCVLAGWAGFLLILRYYCRKRCLVGQGR